MKTKYVHHQFSKHLKTIIERIGVAKDNELATILLEEIKRIKESIVSTKEFYSKRNTRLSKIVSDKELKIFHLKKQMTSMIRGYEKKIQKLQGDQDDEGSNSITINSNTVVNTNKR